MTTTAERVTFAADAGHPLVGRIHRPAGPPRAFALFAHCFTCGKDLAAAVRICEALATRDIATLRFDFTGLGESGGDTDELATFSANVGDLFAAARYLENRHRAPTILIGHSLGGAAVLAAAKGVDACRAVVTIGAPSDPAHVTHLFASSEAELATRGQATVTIGGRSFRVSKAFLEDLAHSSAETRLRDLGRALLIMHAPGDTVVSIDHAAAIYRAAAHPKSFICLDGADHLLRRAADAAYAADVLSAWVSRYFTAS
ncbi:MAG: alpha/beta fold hydrolase [Myxococcota bacterium]